jgi:predicted dehydrogenase
MMIRVVAIGVSHWHALYDAAYLRHLMAMPDVELVAIQDSDAGLVARRAAEVGSPATFTDYRKMLATTRPNFVMALGRHCQMAQIAHDLLDQGYPFLMEKPMGIRLPKWTRSLPRQLGSMPSSLSRWPSDTGLSPHAPASCSRRGA